MRCNKYFTLILLQFVIYVCVWTSWAHIYEYLVLLCKIGCDSKYLSLSRSSSPPRPSPFFSLALSVLGNSSKAEKASTGKVRRGGARLVSYLCRERMKRLGDEIGEVSLESRHS